MASDADIIVDKSINPDATARKRVTQIANLPSVAKVVGLNDLHQGKQETPTSIVTATEGTIFPALSSNVINCGMTLIITDLEAADITQGFITDFCRELDRQSEVFRPDQEDILEMFIHGAEHVTETWECDPDVLEHIENGGCTFDDERPDDATDIVPPWLLRYSGTYENVPIPSLASNHFIEFQVVDEIVDEATAEEWDVSEDQVAIFLHGDYSLTSLINWHHANRLKFRESIPFLDRLQVQLSKAAFHLWRDGIRNFPKNWRLYDDRDLYTGFDTRSPEGKHLIKAFSGAMNFAYANRLLATLCIERSLQEVTDEVDRVDLLWDVGHDTIQAESIDGEEYLIHRKGAAKAVPGKPALISGSYNMNSFLGKGRSSPGDIVSSYDHGCSHVIEYFESDQSLVRTDSQTMMFDRTNGSVTDRIQHIEPTPIETMVNNLVDDGVVSKVAWLRPIANIGE